MTAPSFQPASEYSMLAVGTAVRHPTSTGYGLGTTTQADNVTDGAASTVIGGVAVVAKPALARFLNWFYANGSTVHELIVISATSKPRYVPFGRGGIEIGTGFAFSTSADVNAIIGYRVPRQ